MARKRLMTKTEAAKILALQAVVTARRVGITDVKKLDVWFFNDIRSEALRETGLVKLAAEVFPSWKTVLRIVKRDHIL